MGRKLLQTIRPQSQQAVYPDLRQINFVSWHLSK
jgi:hypothetical protein